MKTISRNPLSAALVAVLLTTPFLVMNALVANQFAPFLAFLRPGGHTGPLEYSLLAFSLLLLPLGAFIALRPVIRRSSGVATT